MGVKLNLQKASAIIISFYSILFYQCSDYGMRKINYDNIAIVIHGGAGTILKENMTPELEIEYKVKLTEALQSGYAILEKGGTSADAVEAAIIILEDSPLFNAGKGAVFNEKGKNELDASFMDGKTLNAGAVAGVSNIKNPISLARAVMEKSPHVMLSGTGAVEFAQSLGYKLVEDSYFHTERRWQQLQKAKDRGEIFIDHSDDKAFNEVKDHKFGTVGAVAIDKNGNICAGTSTGGTTNKRFGRIGDSPVIGAGTYANNKTCGISATGTGEYFIRNVVAYDISAMMEYKNISLKKAAEEVIQNKLRAIGGDGGVVGLDAKGNVVMEFNTKGMYRGFIKKDEEPVVLIYE